MQCYLGYIAFFIAELPLAARCLFLYGLLEVQLAQFVLIMRCAKVAANSAQIERENGRFYVNIQQVCLVQGELLGNSVTISRKRWQLFDSYFILKAERLQLSGRLRPFAMRMLDNYLITSKTFYAVSNKKKNCNFFY